MEVIIIIPFKRIYYTPVTTLGGRLGMLYNAAYVPNWKRKI